MPLPSPRPGLVIHYEYLWRHEHAAGAEQGAKRRPCAIVITVVDTAGKTEVVVAPITHVEPKPPSEGVELPPPVKRYLGLDAERSWVITTDLNLFEWPGVDLYPAPKAEPGKFEYGFLPPRLFEQIRVRIERAGGAAIATKRTE